MGSIEADPDVVAAQARLDAARLMLERTIIRAPVAGVISQRQVQVGQQVTPGAPLTISSITGATLSLGGLLQHAMAEEHVRISGHLRRH